MPAELSKIAVKFFARDPGAVQLPELIPIFHDWIKRRPVEGLLLDVADYSHVQHGPGVVLIGHDVDYYMDSAEGPLGLLASRKGHLEGSGRECILAVLRQALGACVELEREPALAGRLVFGGSPVRLIANDRLAAPNSDRTLETLRPELEAAFRVVYGEAGFAIKRSAEDPRRRFSVSIEAQQAPEPAELLARLGS